MNGDGEDVVAQERRVWHLYHSDHYLSISLVDTQDRHFTISEVRDFIERHVQNGTNDTIVSQLDIFCSGNGPRATEQECALLGRSCQPLAHYLQNLGIGRWTDLETSCILRHMSLQSSTIEFFRMHGSDREMSSSIRTLCNELPASLQTIRLGDVGSIRDNYAPVFLVFTSADCQLLGQMINNQERELDCLQLFRCSFPRLVDFVKLIAGFVKDKIPSDRCEFRSCTVKDTSIPTHDGTDYLQFVRIFGVFWKRRRRDAMRRSQLPTRLEKSARDAINYFRRLQQAGLVRLLPPPSEDTASVTETRQPRERRERREWVEVLGHEAVIDRVDLLFHILLLNPEVCVLEQECSVVASLKTTMEVNGNGEELHETKSPSRKRRKQASK